MITSKVLKLTIRDIPRDFKISFIEEKITIIIVDYGMGNTQSLINAFNFLGIDSVLTSDFENIKKSDICVLPGVGAFPEGMMQLRRLGLVEKIKNYKKN